MSKIIAEWDPQRVKAMVTGRLLANMETAAAFAAAQARAHAPVRTGLLRRSVTHEVHVVQDTVEGRIGVLKGKAFYGLFVEMGTSKMAARPFLRPAVFGNAATILRMVRGG